MHGRRLRRRDRGSRVVRGNGLFRGIDEGCAGLRRAVWFFLLETAVIETFLEVVPVWRLV